MADYPYFWTIAQDNMQCPYGGSGTGLSKIALPNFGTEVPYAHLGGESPYLQMLMMLLTSIWGQTAAQGTYGVVEPTTFAGYVSVGIA